MFWMHPFFAGVMRDNHPDVEFGVFPQPKFEGYERNWHYNNPDVSWGLNPKSSDNGKELAADMLTLFFTDDKYCLDWDIGQCLPPMKYSLMTEPKLVDDPIMKVIMDDFDNSIYVGPQPDALSKDLMSLLIEPVLMNGMDMDAAMRMAVSAANETLADFDFRPVERLYQHADKMR